MILNPLKFRGEKRVFTSSQKQRMFSNKNKRLHASQSQTPARLIIVLFSTASIQPGAALKSHIFCMWRAINSLETFGCRLDVTIPLCSSLVCATLFLEQSSFLWFTDSRKLFNEILHELLRHAQWRRVHWVSLKNVQFCLIKLLFFCLFSREKNSTRMLRNERLKTEWNLIRPAC